MKDRPPRQHSQVLWFLHYSPHYERLMQQPPVLPGYDLSSEMAQRSTPPLLYHRIGDSQITYTAASHPWTRGAPRWGKGRCKAAIAQW
ncbi:hypothetical protein AVEN_232283-1 [Araneus ventricosus]|uniref:Uncharacterized protein n=1 Tax=Araneus ventricosus TaxID=182803 RepID=A0A4Y2LRA4_ARAVE|nr:hypothetical protein AVEN_232283-1 [Araneus ventricosus]